MKIVGFDIEISNVFDLRPGEDIDKYAPFDVAVAATQIHGGEHPASLLVDDLEGILQSGRLP